MCVHKKRRTVTRERCVGWKAKRNEMSGVSSKDGTRLGYVWGKYAGYNEEMVTYRYNCSVWVTC